VKAADRLAADGKNAMAADLIESAEARFPGSDSLKRAKRFTYLKLMEKNQNTDPFKFIIYSGKIGEQTPQINAEQARWTHAAIRLDGTVNALAKPFCFVMCSTLN